jgi:protease I
MSNAKTKVLLFGICALTLFCDLCFGVCHLFAQGGVAKMKRAAMIIPKEDFRDEELFQAKEILEKNGIEVKVASTTLETVKGMLGAKAKPDILITDIKADDFDAIIFVGGSGAEQYWDDPIALKLARDAFNSGRVVAAICIAPVTLARAGILNGKRATVSSYVAGELKSNGASYTGSLVEKDGKVITASGPTAAREFGNELAKALNQGR